MYLHSYLHVRTHSLQSTGLTASPRPRRWKPFLVAVAFPSALIGADCVCTYLFLSQP